jgi:hypothetical protein
MSQVLRSLLVFIGGGAIVVLAADRYVSAPGYRFPKDFIEYWASGRLLLRGENPYNPSDLLAEQQKVDSSRSEAVMMWNPPPALVLYLPLAVTPIRWASLAWVGVQLASVLLACDLLWRVYCPGGRRWIGPLVGMLFVGTWWLVAYGQNTGFLLLGLAGFLHFSLRGQPYLAGATAALTVLKPHLLSGFGVLLLMEVCTRKGRQTLGAGLGVVAGALGLVLCANSNVVCQFLAAVQTPGPGAVPLRAWAVPALSYWLRMWIAPEKFWVQFLPTTVLCVGLVIWRVRSGSEWCWKQALPWVIGWSVLCTPYGGWIFDLPVLLVPVLAVSVRIVAHRRWILFLLFQLGLVTINSVSFATAGALHAFWWVTPAVLATCVISNRILIRRRLRVGQLLH